MMRAPLWSSLAVVVLACGEADDQAATTATGSGSGAGGPGSGGTASAGGAAGAGSGAEGGGGSRAGCDWDPRSLPLPIAIHPGPVYGGIALDASCDLLVAGALTGELYRIDRLTGAVTTAASGLANYEFRGVAYRASDGEVFAVGHTGGLVSKLHRIVGGSPLEVMELPAILNDIAIAPAGFGAYGDLVLGAGQDSGVYAIDPSVPSAVQIGTASSPLADLVFAEDGSVLYLASTETDSILTMTPDGTLGTLVTDLTVVDGLALDPSGLELYASHWSIQQGGAISTVTLSNGMVAPYALALIDTGHATTGLVVDATGDLLMKSSLDGNAVLVAP